MRVDQDVIGPVEMVSDVSDFVRCRDFHENHAKVGKMEKWGRQNDPLFDP